MAGEDHQGHSSRPTPAGQAREPERPAADQARDAGAREADAQQHRIRAVREAQWQKALLDGPDDDVTAPGGDKPNVVRGDIQSSWRWHDETNALLRAAIESANDAVIITEVGLEPPGPRIEYVNPAFTAMTGYTLDEVIGQTPRILQGPKTDRALIHRLRDDLLNGRVFHGETINYRKDGGEYVVEWRITAMRGPDGQVLKWVAVQRDVTERRHAEERRERQLADERAAREGAERAREEAERVGRMKDEFLATLSHELRTPLNAILGWTQLLQRGTLGADEARKAVDTVERNARTQAQLIEDLLDMSRIMSGNFRLDLKPTSVSQVVSAAVQSLRPVAEAKGVELSVDCGTTPIGAVMADASRLQQVVWNLISNATKFTPPGGRVSVCCVPAGEHVELVVADTGAGIDGGFLPFVFDRFRQADASTTRNHGGLGLGLAIVKHLVELHGGSVRAESGGVGHGATFTVRLPLAQQPDSVGEAPGEDAAPAPAENEDLIRLTDLRVMIVEDDADAREFVTRALEDAGAAVEAFEAAAPALDRLADEAAPRVDVLVSDISMPEADGYELIRRLRQRPADRHGLLPAIALTAFARPEDRRRALLAGYQSHLPKPVDTGDLLVEIQSVADRGR